MIPEFGGDDFDALGRAVHGVVPGGFDNDGEHVIFEGVDDTAAEDDVLGVEEVDDITDGDAGVFGGFFDDFFDQFIAFFEGFAQVTAAEVFEFIAEHVGEDGFLAIFDGFLEAAEDGGAGGEGFEATAVAAAAFGSADLEDHVTDFAGGAVEAGVEVAVEDEAAADAGAEEDADQVARFAAQFDGMNAEGADIAIVLDEDRDTEVFFEVAFEGDILPAGEVGGIEDAPFTGVDGAGGADADGADLFEVEVGFIDGIANGAGDAFDDDFGATIGLGTGFTGGD